jgi:hypothetical protein
MDRFRDRFRERNATGSAGQREPVFRVERRSTRVEPRVRRPAPGYVGDEVIERVGAGEDRDDGETGETRDSWVDAFVTLFAIVLVGLGWALVELEGADRAANRYVPPVSEMRVALVEAAAPPDPGVEFDAYPALGRVEEASWTAPAPQSSNP